jgi:hypothetical protein
MNSKNWNLGFIFAGVYVLMNLLMFLGGVITSYLDITGLNSLFAFGFIFTLLFPGMFVFGIDGPGEYLPSAIFSLLMYFLLGALLDYIRRRRIVSYP